VSIFWHAPEFRPTRLGIMESGLFEFDAVSPANGTVYENTGTTNFVRADYGGMARTVLFA
jgi:hypothetical protein